MGQTLTKQNKATEGFRVCKFYPLGLDDTFLHVGLFYLFEKQRIILF